MSSHRPPTPDRHPGGRLPGDYQGLNRWKKTLLLAASGALALMVAGQPTLTSVAQAAPQSVKATGGTAVVAPPPAPVLDAGSMVLVTDSTGARAYWKAGYTGKGVDIAIVDSGVAPVEGLSTPGKVILGPDLSFESQDPANRYLDTNGHGTHLAGILAGRDAAASGNYADDVTSFLGMAPDARLVSVKVADAQGHTDVTQVIAAINWVAQHKNDNGMNIRVLLLAFGTDSVSPWEHDPLVFAAEQAWKQGIFVVVSAGNDGPAAFKQSTLTNLASSPNLFVIGASDTQGTATLLDDAVAPFSSGARGERAVDVVAPGSHIIGLKAPGSYVDQKFSSTGAYGDRFFRGSGTSQAAAVAAGAAALVIQEQPGVTPDALRALLMRTSTPLAGTSWSAQGEGALTLANVLGRKAGKTKSSNYWSDGLGTLDSARGSNRLAFDGQVLSGQIDIFRAPFDSAAMAKAEANAFSWSGGAWNGNEWAASSWSASSWSASSWSASSWSASSWSASSWSASSWSASSWSASSWSASSWSASSWSASSWSASSWSSAAWE
ncbi:MAG: S8 family serine peptidase [Dehalococcoidia bacterium]|nr:S8 family serine peptidase [Dehalococcoidia bacterium]